MCVNMFIRVHVCVPVRGRESVCVFVCERKREEARKALIDMYICIYMQHIYACIYAYICSERKREETRKAAKESEYDKKMTLICIYAYICSDANTRRDAHRQKAQYWAQQNQGIQEGLLDPMHTFASPHRVQVCVCVCVRVCVCVWMGEWGWVWMREGECGYASVFMSDPMHTFASPHRVQVMMIGKADIASDKYSMVQCVIGKEDKRSMEWLRLVGTKL